MPRHRLKSYTSKEYKSTLSCYYTYGITEIYKVCEEKLCKVYEPAGAPGDSVTVEELKRAKQEAMPEAHGASQVTAIGAAQVAEGLAKERQVEEIQPEQAQQIAAEAPPPIVNASAPEVKPEESVQPPQEEEKRKRIRKAPTAATPANAKALEDTIAYLGSPVADTMALEDIEEEIRKCRDLGVVLARRMANLYAAGTLIPKRKLAAVSAILN